MRHWYRCLQPTPGKVGLGPGVSVDRDRADWVGDNVDIVLVYVRKVEDMGNVRDWSRLTTRVREAEVRAK